MFSFGENYVFVAIFSGVLLNVFSLEYLLDIMFEWMLKLLVMSGSVAKWVAPDSMSLM
jgi:hypothetical protein